jgi:dienelactone hydrolase
MSHIGRFILAAIMISLGLTHLGIAGENASLIWEKISPAFTPPKEYAGQYGSFRSPLLFDNGEPVETASNWGRRRTEIRADWMAIMGKWPPFIDKPKIETLETQRRENFTQRKVRVEISRGQMDAGYLLIPDGDGPFPAVFVPFYDAETSIGLGKLRLHDFAYQLTRRGFVTLSIGSPGGNARKPDLAGNTLQPLSYLGYIGANCYNALASLPNVDANRIGVVGHSYGGKWAMFTSCLYDKYAAAAWSDPGIIWDEKRSAVNYWEPWYLGLDAEHLHKPGLITPDNPRTGAYRDLLAAGHDLHELHALMAPRPFLVSGGSEDSPARWVALNHSIAVNALLGQTDRVAMTHRPAHQPTTESNEEIYLFFEHFLMGK